MKHGDLSSQVAPRIVIVFEGAVGFIMDSKDKNYQRALKKGHWDVAVRYWKLNEQMLGRILYLVNRKSVNIEICTWMEPEMAEAIKDYLDETGIPVRDVWASTPAKLSRELAYLPDIIAVYDPSDDHVFTFGSKGVLLRNANQIGGML